MVRSATFSTVLSRTTTSRLMTNTARIRQRCGWPRLAGADGAADEVDVTDMRIPHVFDTDLNRYACDSYSKPTLLRIESDTEPFRNEISVSWATPRPGILAHSRHDRHNCAATAVACPKSRVETAINPHSSRSCNADSAGVGH